MKTWLERTDEARAKPRWGITSRGYTDEDRRLAFPLATCAVGETAARYGVSVCALVERAGSKQGHKVYLGSRFLVAVLSDDYDAALRILGELDDLALALKREGTANGEG
jgi:hypothetical protein